MRQRVKDVVAVGDNLFSQRGPWLSLCQTIAENFHVMRADFTRTRYFSEEFGSYLMTGRPARCHRDLKNSFSAMLRRDQWFHAKTDSETVNEDRDAKIWLDWASKTQRRAMYDRRASFVRATKEADGDFCAFGNAIITREIVDYEHFLYQCWHPRDVVWDDNVKRQVDTAHFKWGPQARQLVQKFKNNKNGEGISPAVMELANSGDKRAFEQINCRRMLIPSDEYDLAPEKVRGMPFVSVYVDVDNETILEEIPLRNFPATIPRWEFGGTLYGSQIGYSPAVVYGLPDARMMQQIMLSMLEASEKGTSPPMIAVGEAINGGVNFYAAGLTQVDADYDERTGEVLRPITMQFEGIKYGAQQLERLEASLDDAFYLSKIRFPQITKEMTAYEASKLWEDFQRETLPLFEPVQDEYNGAICDGTFDDMLAHGAFGSIDDMPQILRGRDISWQFDTPITVAVERALTSSFQSMMQTLTEGAQADPGVVANVDLNQATRDAISGGGAPAKWLLPVDQVKQIQQQKAQQQQEQAAAEQVAHGADVATRVGNAAKSAGDAAQSLQDAGVGQ